MLTSGKQAVNTPKQLPNKEQKLTSRQSQAIVKIPQCFPKTEAEKQREQELLRDIQLLLENLAEREETTVKMILDCLYDIGSINLINKKFRSRPLNGMMKLIASTSKPIFKILAIRWFKKNVPDILTKWLHEKVKF
jgi:hypothetical protein